MIPYLGAILFFEQIFTRASKKVAGTSCHPSLTAFACAREILISPQGQYNASTDQKPVRLKRQHAWT